MSTFELVWDSRSGVSECPVWDPATRRLYFCDIPGKRINASRKNAVIFDLVPPKD